MAVSKGLLYERLTLRTLLTYSFSIKHEGKPGDKGKDFAGEWVLPDRQIRIIGEGSSYFLWSLIARPHETGRSGCCKPITEVYSRVKKKYCGPIRLQDFKCS